MTLLEIISTILIEPLKLLFELIFNIVYEIIGQPGPTIIILSIIINLLLLPLYKRADTIQIKTKDTEKKLRNVVKHIKKTFKGDEQMMILNTYYRQNNYSPLSVFNNSISLLLQIPFFIAAYQFLSNLEVLQNTAFGPITNLSTPDNLLTIGTLTINILPILMTIINVIGSYLYLKDFPLKTKIQLYAMAGLFLILLYNSPSALVLYWTLNNVFSLIKTLVYKFNSKKKKVVKEEKQYEPNKKLFTICTIFITLLVGIIIPSSCISTSVQEFMNINYIYNPIWYVINTLCIVAGIFLVWTNIFYKLSSNKGKYIISNLILFLTVIISINYMFFGRNHGLISPNLVYYEGLNFNTHITIINIIVLIISIFIIYKLSKKYSIYIYIFISLYLIGVITLSTINTVYILYENYNTKKQLEYSNNGKPNFNLSTTGKNVVIIMLDRGYSRFVPYIFEEIPGLQEKYDGFTNYTNTLSYGPCTNFSAPALYGGYDYTPININLRKDELLKDKHNEALKVMPKLFSDKNFNVTVIDPSYAGYKEIPDLRIYKDINNINTYLAQGLYNKKEDTIKNINIRRNNFFYFSLMKISPVFLQSTIYNNGKYKETNNNIEVSSQFMDSYNVLKNLNTMVNITENNENTFMFLRNNITHEPEILQEPSYEPYNINNNAYGKNKTKEITYNNEKIILDNYDKISHYHSNASALIQLGNWLDYLKENNVYDNTRIIITSDHGFNLHVFDKKYLNQHNTELYQSILLVKDFNSHGYTINEEFMTNADVPTIATNNLIENPINPYTGNKINSNYKKENRNYVIISSSWDIAKNKGKQFKKSNWGYVSDDIRDLNNWHFEPNFDRFPESYKQKKND